MTKYEKFQELLKKHYGIDPLDVGVDTEDDYHSLAGSDTPGSVVAWLGRKYGLDLIREELCA
jgi:hypothetical protein